MDSFEFQSPTKFILDQDADLLCGQEVKQFSDRVLFVHAGDFTYSSGLHKRITDTLADVEVTYFELPDVEPNPQISLVRRGVEICKQEQVGCILAVGGGSVIDTAKAVALGAKYDGDVWDFFTGQATPGEVLPIGAVMTFPATGSEGSNGSVISNRETGEKLDVMAESLRPAFALMNPELTLTLPKQQTVFGIIDIFSHVMERYFSSSVDTVLTDHMCEGVMQSIIVNARKLMDNMDDYNTRAEFMWTAILAHNGLLGTGRNQDWSSHIIGAQLSAGYNAIHGATLSVLFPVWAAYVCEENLPRFVQFAHRVFGVEVDFYDQQKTAKEGIRQLREFFTYLGGPKSLAEIGIDTDEKFSEMAANACKFGKIGGIKQLDVADVERIYQLAR